MHRLCHYFVMKKLFIISILFSFCFFKVSTSFSQAVPSKNENIPFIVTFGKDSEKSWGDDDNNQIVFFSIPQAQKSSFYIRIFDPNTGGKHDEKKVNFNTKTKFSLYGAGCFSNKDEENKDPVGNYKKGNLIHSKTFGSENTYDDKWYTFGPINPLEGELLPDLGGYIFKLNIDGTTGDDGNLYQLFMSVSNKENKKVEGGNAFMYEYSFRLNSSRQISHLYPYVDQYTTSVIQSNFDFDDDAYIRLKSMSNVAGEKIKASLDGFWQSSEHVMQEKDKKTCLDVQIVKTGQKSNNNAVFSIKNQRGEFMQFHSIPIGVIPKRQGKYRKSSAKGITRK